LGLAYLHKQGSFRALAAYQFVPETTRTPSLNGSVGAQGIGTGNPGYSLTAEKNFEQREGSLNIFSGLGYRSNEDHAHWIGGLRYQLKSGLAFGLQLDGHQHNPFVVYSHNQAIFGFYLIDGKSPAYLVGLRF